MEQLSPRRGAHVRPATLTLEREHGLRSVSVNARQAGARGATPHVDWPRARGWVRSSPALRTRGRLRTSTDSVRDGSARTGMAVPVHRGPGSGVRGFGVRGLGSGVWGPAVPGTPCSSARLVPPEPGRRQDRGSTAHCCCAIPPLQTSPGRGFPDRSARQSQALRPARDGGPDSLRATQASGPVPGARSARAGRVACNHDGSRWPADREAGPAAVRRGRRLPQPIKGVPGPPVRAALDGRPGGPDGSPVSRWPRAPSARHRRRP